MKFRFLLVLPLCALLAGCMDTSAVLQVRKDGSADLVVKFFPDPGALGAVAFRKPEAAGASDSLLDRVLDITGQVTPEFFNPFHREDLENVARALGRGVTLARTQAIRLENGTEGVLAVFRVADVNQLRLGPVQVDENGKVPANPVRPWAYAFRFQRGETAVLSVVPPDPAQVRGGVSIGESMGDIRNLPGFDRIARRMIQNARFRLQIQVDGELTASNASFPVAGRNDMILLADVKLATLVQSQGLEKVLKIQKPSDLAPIAGKNTPGLLLENPGKTLQLKFK